MGTCDICGYKSDLIVKYPDGILRCTVCMHKAAYGRYIPDYEVNKMSQNERTNLYDRFDLWYDSLENDSF